MLGVAVPLAHNLPCLLHATSLEFAPQALQSVYQSADLAFSGAERACLAAAHEVVDNSSNEALLAAQLQELGDVAGSIRLPEVEVEGQPAFLHFQLPASYPDTSAQLRVESEGRRRVLVLQTAASTQR